MEIMRKNVAQCNSYYKTYLNKSYKKQFTLNLQKKLTIDQSQKKTCKFFQTKRLWIPTPQVIRPDKIIKFFDFQFPLNSKYLNPTKLIFGYKPFSRMRYLKKIESISRDNNKNNFVVQFIDINVDKLKPEHENIQSNLLRDWLENINTPEALKQAKTLSILKHNSNGIKYYSLMQPSTPNTIEFIKKLNRATIRNINKFAHFSLIFATDFRKNEFNFSLNQIELNQRVCELAKLDQDCQSDKHEFVYEFLGRLFTMKWIDYFYLQLNSFNFSIQEWDCYKLRKPDYVLEKDCLYLYNEKTRICNNFSDIYFETFLHEGLMLFKFVHVLKKKRPNSIKNC